MYGWTDGRMDGWMCVRAGGRTYVRTYVYIYIYTIWLFNIAMENGPFIDGLPIKNGDFPFIEGICIKYSMFVHFSLRT